MQDPTLWLELLAYGSAISLSPIHIGLLLLLLLGPHPLRRGGVFVLGWWATASAMLAALLGTGHGLLLSMSQGTHHRTVLDLIGAGALLGLGLQELLPTKEGRRETAGWVRQLDRLVTLPLPLLIGAGAAIEVVSPDDLFLFAKAAGALLAAQLNRSQELIYASGFSLFASLLLVLPFLAVLLGRGTVLPWLERGRGWLFGNGQLVAALVSLLLAVYLGWQGIEGLVGGSGG